MKGRLIAIEGIDGCGKSTQIRHLSEWLPNSGLMPENAILHITREPGGTDLGKSLRKILLHAPKEESPSPLTELLLYAADRAQHISQVIAPLLEKGDWVITDRFSGSTLAYQGFGRKLNIDLINNLESIATQGISPDITLLLNLSVKTSLKRREQQTKDRIEGEGYDFLEKVSSGFATIAKERNWVIIQAEKNASLISQEIEEQLYDLLKK
tara:strand:- start:211 stop:843 length:633 start_codon:yes stop_codon:yes gene_type:complete